MPASLTRRLLADERGHTLVELSVYLVLSVLAVGLAFAVVVVAHRGISVWQDTATQTNALAGATSRIDADLRHTESVTATGPATWRLDRHGAAPVTYRSVDGRVVREGRRLHGPAVEMALDLQPTTGACRPGTCLARARIEVRAVGAGDRQTTPPVAPVEWHVLLSPSPWTP